MSNRIMVDCAEDCPDIEWIERVEPFLQSALEALGLDKWELSVLFCTDPFIAELNKQYREIDSPTDVLSFEQGDEYVDDDGAVWFSAGDIVVSVDTLGRNAQEFNVSVDEELKRLLVHGILHLDGMDHSDNSPEQEMLLYQEKILASLADKKILA